MKTPHAKKSVIIIALIFSIITLINTAFAVEIQAKEIYVYFDSVHVCINGNMVEMNTLSYNGTVYLEARRFSENLVVDVSWNYYEQRVDIKNTPVLPERKTGEKIELEPKKLEAKDIWVEFGVTVYFNEEPINCVDATGAQAPPFIWNGVTYLPVRSIVDTMGYSIGWDETTRTVFVGEVLDPMPVLKPVPVEESLVETIVYGNSEMGRELIAYRIKGLGANDKTVFMVYTQHGFEDSHWRSGESLRVSAMEVKNHFEMHPEDLADFQLILVPVANPDGLYDGVNNYYADKDGAFGRCTSTGVDMNRDWRDARFWAVETRALRDLVVSYKDTTHMLVDFHGYLNGFYGDPLIGAEFAKEFGFNDRTYIGYAASSGYLMGYAKESIGIPHCALIEYKDIWSVDTAKTVKAMKALFEKI